MSGPVSIYAIADLHLSKIGKDDLLTLIENWPGPDDVVIVVGDTDTPDRLCRWPFSHCKNVVVVPGNSDPVHLQSDVAYHLVKDRVAIYGHLGANWTETPWAHYHLHDQPCDPEPIIEWLEYEAAKCTANTIILALHYPLSYERERSWYYHKRFASLVRSDRRIQCVLHGHVHKGVGEIPPTLEHARLYNVAADRVGYRPVLIATVD